MAPHGSVSLSVACGDYDHTRPLLDGTVSAVGLELQWSSPPIEEIIADMLREQSFDVAEMSLAAAAIAVERGDPPLVPLPIFPSRFFRHSCVFVHSDAPISSMHELAGKRVGMANYHRMAAAVWFKGILSDDHGIQPHDIEWYVSSGDASGERDGIYVDHGDRVKIVSIGPGQNLDVMLQEGEIDALLAVRMPEPYRRGSSRVRRLLDDSEREELEYYRRTGVFPIMHTMVVRRGIVEAHPDVGPALCQAFNEAKEQSLREHYDLDASRHLLAWWTQYLERERDLLGPDAWAYGLQPNYPTLEIFLRYCHEQGLTRDQLSPEELFAECPWSPE